MNTNAPAPRQAIVTKFLPCTNSRPSRVKATAEAGSVTLSWEHGLNGDGNHARAAKALADKFGWKGFWFGGALPGTSGYAFVSTGHYKPQAGDAVLAEYAHFVTEGKN